MGEEHILIQFKNMSDYYAVTQSKVSAGAKEWVQIRITPHYLSTMQTFRL